MKKIILICILLFGAFTFNAQDFHVSQYDVTGLYLNPATTGVYDNSNEHYKATLLTRSQWRSVGIKPFFTSYLSFDTPLYIKDKKLGVGGYLINNSTGKGNFNTTGFMLSAAYNLLDKSAIGKHILSTGLQVGLFYKAMNNNGDTYDSQYSYSLDGGSFDQSIASGETTAAMSVVKFDANFGIYYKMIDVTKKFHPFVGLSIAHLTRPNEALTGDISKMPFRFMLNGGCDIKLDEKFDVTPRFILMNQAKAYEYNFGFLSFYKLNDKNMKAIAGADYRIKDAVVLSLGMIYDQYNVRFSYDVNTSYLKNYTNGRGAWELTLVYVGKKPLTKSISDSKF